jgi:lysine 6-dehydrogenase
LRVLRESGFFSYDEIEVKGVKVRPIDVTSKLLFPKWKLKPGEQEFTVMKIQIDGKDNYINVRHEYYVLDRTDMATNTLSMARTTGFTCTAAVHLVADGKFNRKGICPPEYLGEDEGNFKFIVNYLRQRNVNYDVSTTPTPES